MKPRIPTVNCLFFPIFLFLFGSFIDFNLLRKQGYSLECLQCFQVPIEKYVTKKLSSNWNVRKRTPTLTPIERQLKNS
jgi:hypothetical protein